MSTIGQSSFHARGVRNAGLLSDQPSPEACLYSSGDGACAAQTLIGTPGAPIRLFRGPSTEWNPPMSRARIALITTLYPLGSASGAQLRLQAIASAGERVGDLEIIYLRKSTNRDQESHAEGEPLAIHDFHQSRMGRVQYLVWLLIGRTPPPLVGIDGSGTPEPLRRKRPDLIICHPTTAFAAAALPSGVPVVIDVNDLEGLKNRSLREHRRMRKPGLRRSARSLFDAFAGRRVEKSWFRYYQRLKAAGHTLITCSPADAEYIGSSEWAPNGYEIPLVPLGDPAVDSGHPTFVFIGLLSYPPNREAIDELVSEIWPAVRSEVPDAELVIVGAGSERWSDVDEPSITFTGALDSLDPIIRAATATIIPIRSGGGTRLKVLEAFAHRVPVIATDFAVSGLDVEANIHYARAHDAEEFARQSRALVADSSRRVELADCAEKLVAASYSSESAIATFESVFRARIR